MRGRVVGMGTKSGLLVALLVSASAYSGVSKAAEWTGHQLSVGDSHSAGQAIPSIAVRSSVASGPMQIRVRPPAFSSPLPSLEEGFAYVDLRRPVALSVAGPRPPIVNGVDAPTFEETLPELEEGFTGLRTPVRAYPAWQSIRIA